MKNSYRITHLDKSSPRGKRNCGLKYIFITLNTLLLALFIALPAANGQDSSSFETLQGQPDEIMTLKHGRQSRNPAPTSEHLPDGKIAAVSEMIQTSPAAGELDSAFNPTFDRFNGNAGNARVVAVQPDGKIIVGGYFKSLNGNAHSGIVRFNPDGSFDNAFNPNINDTVFAIALQPDGKIVVGGNFTSVNGVSRNRIARLNADGSLDTSFNPGSGASNGVIYAVAVQANGKIIVGGFFNGFNGTDRFNLVRLNADGSIDNTNRKDNPGFVYVIKIQPDGKILIGGNFDLFSTPSIRHLYRLNADYSLDTSFQVSLPVSAQIRDVAVQTDGKILIGGNFTTVNGVSRSRIARLNSNGSLDTSFNPGTGANNTVHSFDVQTNGKILIGGAFSVYDGVDRRSIAQINSDGSLDTSFNPGTGFNGTVFSAKFLANGQIFVGGAFSTFNGVNRQIAVRLNADGSLDPSVALTEVTTAAAMRVAVTQPDGKVVAGGFFSRVNGANYNNIVRLNADGTVDTSFNSGTGANDEIYTMLLQTDGKIIIGGFFTSYNGVSRNRIARLNADGSLDTSFNIGTGVSGSVYGLALQADGKVLIVGTFTSVNGISRNSVARLNTDGSVDTSFNAPPLGSSIYIEGIAVQPDGKIVLGGIFDSAQPPYRLVVRLNTDGSLDASFTPPTTNTNQEDGVYALALQPDGKILIGGIFSVINGVSRRGIARLNANGTLDTSFNVGTGVEYVEDIVVQPDGKIIIGGRFSSFNGIARQNVARLNADGSLDTSFTATADNTVWDISLSNDNGKALISGDFLTVNGVSRAGLARLQVESTSSRRTRFDFDGDGKADVSVFRPSNGVWYLLNSFSGFSAAQFGISSDKIVPADYDGDGRTDLAVYRNGNWYISQSSNNQFRAVSFGVSEDLPRPGDFDGDGRADIAVFRPSSGIWYRLNSSNGQFAAVQFGQSGDVPMIVDFDGDGKSDIAVWRPSNGVWYWIRSSDNQFQSAQFGASGDVPVSGDFDNDGKSDLTVYRPSNGFWYIARPTGVPAQNFISIQFGSAADLPAAADYDGDGKTDIAVWRPSNGVWYIFRSTDNQFQYIQFGVNGDKPISNAFVP